MIARSWQRDPKAHRALRFLACLLAVWLPLHAVAAPQICDAAAMEAAQKTGVPLELLRTLTRVETGRGGSQAAPDPWPWTLNMAGDGSWHDSAEAALTVARRAIAEGRRNIDIGCFQINYRWHGDQFRSLEAMMDPTENALYAARFLHDLQGEFGNWMDAAAVFHSRNPDHATRYMARFFAIRAALPPMRGSRGAPTGPVALTMTARPALVGPPGAVLVNRARPLAATAARPLWERQ